MADLGSQLRLGAEYFLNRTDTRETVFENFRMMHDSGLSVARIFVIWDDVERDRGQWDFHRYDWIYEAARQYQIKIAATLCAEDPPGWMKLTPFYHGHMNLDDPKLRERASVYIDKVVGRYKDNPAQGAWVLMNEPHPEINYQASTMQVFGQWLKSRYGTIENLNRRWFRPLQSFSDVQLTPQQLEERWTDYYPVVDWREFNDDNVVQTLRWISTKVRALDSKHPTHINPDGGDFWREAETVDSFGASIHPVWLFQGFKRQDFGVPFAYYVNIVASAAGSKP